MLLSELILKEQWAASAVQEHSNESRNKHGGVVLSVICTLWSDGSL